MVGFAEIEFQAVQLGKAQELSNAKIAEVAVRQQIGQHVVPVFITRGGWRTSIATGYHFEIWIRRIAGKIFVGINVKVRGVIDRQQFYLVEIDGLFQRLHETEAELAVFFADGGCGLL